MLFNENNVKNTKIVPIMPSLNIINGMTNFNFLATPKHRPAMLEFKVQIFTSFHIRI